MIELRNEITRVANAVGESVTHVEATYYYSENNWRWGIRVYCLDGSSTLVGTGNTLREAGDAAIKRHHR